MPRSAFSTARSRFTVSSRPLLGRALGFALTSIVWLLPPPVLPLPSRSGAEGPPRPYGREPAVGSQPARTPAALAQTQTRALLDGPFPPGGLERGVSEGALLFDSDASVRTEAFTKIAQSGARLVRIPVDWRDLVSAQPPVGFDPRDPASPYYGFAALDAAVRGASAAGLETLLVVSHAPAFAEAPGRWPYAYPGSWAPSPAALEAFAFALARRYDGSFPDPSEPGQELPRVKIFQAWNEPNLARYLEPQWVADGGHWSAFSPLLYRQMLNAFYAGVKAVAPGDLIVTAGVAPNGEPDGEGRMAPVRFLRALLCLHTSAGDHGRLQREPCGDPPHFDVLAFHPLSVGDPDRPAVSSLDLAISDASKITGLLKGAERLGTALPTGAKPVWVTELNWESQPATARGVPHRLQALWVSRALHRLWVAGVSTVAWQFLRDPFPAARASTPTGGLVEYSRFAGLYSAGPGGGLQTARPKAFLRGFRLPFDPLRFSRIKVRIWALLSDPSAPAELQRETPQRSWRTVMQLQAAPDGILNTLVEMRGGMTLRLRRGALVSAPAELPSNPPIAGSFGIGNGYGL